MHDPIKTNVAGIDFIVIASYIIGTILDQITSNHNVYITIVDDSM